MGTAMEGGSLCLTYWAGEGLQLLMSLWKCQKPARTWKPAAWAVAPGGDHVLGCGPGWPQWACVAPRGWRQGVDTAGWHHLLRFIESPSDHPHPKATSGPCTVVPTLLLPIAASSPSLDIVIAIKIGAELQWLLRSVWEERGPAVSRPPAGRGPRMFHCRCLAVFHVGLNIIKRHIPFEKQELPC